MTHQLIKILILEDQLIIARDLKGILQSLGYAVVGMVTSVKKAEEILRQQPVDLILLDIIVQGDEDGIDLAQKIREQYHIPFIFITSHSDPNTLERAKNSEPYGYLLKPFEDDDVRVAIDMALYNFHKQTSQPTAELETELLITDSLFIKDRGAFKKLYFEDIHYIKADSNYCHVKTADREYTLRSTLKDFDGKLPSFFLRVHKSYIANIQRIDRLDATHIVINGNELPINREMYALITQGINKI